MAFPVEGSGGLPPLQGNMKGAWLGALRILCTFVTCFPAQATYLLSLSLKPPLYKELLFMSKLFNKALVICGHDTCPTCGDFAEEVIVYNDPAEATAPLLKREDDVALFVDVKHYLQLGAEARNRLLAVAQGTPLYRISRDTSAGTFRIIDDPQKGPGIAPSTTGRLQLRSEERVPVQLNAIIAKEDNPFLHEAEKANILNITAHGSFIFCVGNAAYKDFLYLRIKELSNKRPILCSIRWHRAWGIEDSLPGMGVQFVDIQADQISELETMYITPHLHDLDKL